MAEEDNDARLKRDRPEGEEEEAGDENEPSERPVKMAKKEEDTKETSEEEKAGDSEGSGACQGSNCGTDLNSDDKGSDADSPEEGNPAEENPQSSSAVAKEEAKETAEDAVPTVEETKTAETGADAEAAKSSPENVPTSGDETPAEEKAPEATSAPDLGVSGLPPMGGAEHPPEPGSTVNFPQSSSVEERAEIHKDLVGRVIGKGGEMIRDLQARSGCRVDVDQNVEPEAPRIITYRGTRESVDFAKQLVETLCSQDGRDTELPLGMASRKELVVPASSIGKVIGRGGEMIRDLQTRSKCKIQVDHSGAGVVDPTTRLVVVTGTEDAVVKAEEMILFLVANPTMDASTAIDMLVDDKARGGIWGSGPPYPNLPNQGRGMQGQSGYGYGTGPGGYPGQPVYQQPYGGGYGAAGVEMEVFHAAKNYMGRIIGQRGVTINDLQTRSGCDIQINQDVPYGQDCEISLKGSRQSIETAKTMLREVIEMGPNHPYAGGAGAGAPQMYAGGGVYPQAAYGQAPVMQQQAYSYQQPVAQPGAYGGAYAYGAPAAYQPAPYIQSEMAYQAQQYGMPQQQQQAYGGYVQQPPMQAPPPHAGAPASLWRTATTAEGQTYYYNEKTGETQWEKPAGM